MNDKITAVTANLNSILVRLDWIREQNYNDPDAVDLMGDVAEWVCEIDEAVEAIEKSLTPALFKGESVGRVIEGWGRDEVSGEERCTPDCSNGDRGVGTHPNNSTGDGGVGTQFGDSPSDKEEGTHPLIPSQEGKL